MKMDIGDAGGEKGNMVFVAGYNHVLILRSTDVTRTLYVQLVPEPMTAAANT